MLQLVVKTLHENVERVLCAMHRCSLYSPGNIILMFNHEILPLFDLQFLWFHGPMQRGIFFEINWKIHHKKFFFFICGVDRMKLFLCKLLNIRKSHSFRVLTTLQTILTLPSLSPRGCLYHTIFFLFVFLSYNWTEWANLIYYFMYIYKKTKERKPKYHFIPSYKYHAELLCQW